MTPSTPEKRVETPECSHYWVGDTCATCGIAHHIYTGNRIRQLEQELQQAHQKGAQEFIDAHHNPIVAQLNKELQRVREELARHNRDGNWCDKWGACRVCDGEIPHGHTDNCDVYKQEQQIRDLQSQLSQWRECASGLYRLTKGLFTTQQQVDEILARYDELPSTPQTTEARKEE